jgi:hypothetical protein
MEAWSADLNTVLPDPSARISPALLRNPQPEMKSAATIAREAKIGFTQISLSHRRFVAREQLK